MTDNPTAVGSPTQRSKGIQHAVFFYDIALFLVSEGLLLMVRELSPEPEPVEGRFAEVKGVRCHSGVVAMLCRRIIRVT